MMNLKTIKWPLQARLKTSYKTRLLYAYWDGYTSIELYKDKEESIWVATIDLNTIEVRYYWSKFSQKPKIDTYILTIPSLKIICYKFVLDPVPW